MLYQEIERLVLAGAICRVRLRPDLYRQLVREVLGTHFDEGPTFIVSVAGVLVTQRDQRERYHHTLGPVVR